jgi:GntR family transcriptional regulator, transcriptional repressor for pyruvate dehydrogenase complex
MMEVNPINNKRIYQSVIEQLVKLITEGKLHTGEKLPPERTLAEMFDVSRASIREAFSAMEIIGLIEVRPGEGSFVADLNLAPFINTIAPLFVKNENLETELLDFRMLLEQEAVEMAALKTNTNSLQLLQDSIREMEKAIAKEDNNLGAEADIAFHRAIFALTGNFILIKASEFIASLLECSVRFNRTKILKDPGNAKDLYQQHQQIYQAIYERQPELAKELIRKHLGYVRELS